MLEILNYDQRKKRQISLPFYYPNTVAAKLGYNGANP